MGHLNKGKQRYTKVNIISNTQKVVAKLLASHSYFKLFSNFWHFLPLTMVHSPLPELQYIKWPSFGYISALEQKFEKLKTLYCKAGACIMIKRIWYDYLKVFDLIQILSSHAILISLFVHPSNSMHIVCTCLNVILTNCCYLAMLRRN